MDRGPASSQPYSPTRRETRIPTPSSSKSSPRAGGASSSRGGSFSRGGGGISTSPSRKVRTPTLGKSWSGKKQQSTPQSSSASPARKKSPKRPHPSPVNNNSTSTNRRNAQQPIIGCAGASMDLLETGLKRTTQPCEQLLHEEATREQHTAAARNGGDSSPGNTPWMSMINHLYEQHAEEKSQWKKDLNSAKQKSRHYKEELRDNLTERLRFLESKVLEQEDDDGEDLSRGGSATTNTTQDGTSCSEATNALQQRQQVVDAGNVEVVYESMSDAKARKRVEHLEQRLQQANLAHTFEKEHWLATLDEAAKATEDGAELSKKVHGILEQVATDWQEIHEEELLTASQTMERLEQRMREIEQSHEQEKVHWQNETAKLKDDSRRLLRERNEYKGKLSRHKEELEKSKATLSELERKVDLCQRQTSLAQKKAIQWEEKAVSLRPDSLRQDPPSPERPESAQQQLKRAMQERDAALKEAEETCKMLEDYQNRLESDRQSYNTKLKQAEEKYAREVDRRVAEFKNELVEQYQNVPLSEVPHAELERRYRDSVEKRNELASRMRQLQDQVSNEKGNWKLKLEGSLSENRKLKKDKENLKAQNENLREQNQNLDAQLKALGNEQKGARANWESRLEQASKEWVERLSEIQEEHQRETEELKETMNNLREYKENAETLANETRKQLDNLKDKHRQDVLEWKEREVRTSQKTLFEAKEEFATELQTVHKEIARLEHQTASRAKEVQEIESQLEDEKKKAIQFRSHHEKVVAEWEDHAKKLQVDKEQKDEELKAALEKGAEREKRLTDWEQRTDDQEKDVARLQRELEAAATKAKELEQALDEVLDEHDEASIVHRGIVEQHEAERKDWDAERDDLNARNLDLQQQVDQHETERKVENVKISNLEDEVSSWKGKIIKAASERDAALAEVSALSERLSTLQQDELEDLKLLKEENKQLQKLSQSHGAQIDVWKSKSARRELELARAIESRDEERQQAVDRIESLEVENEKLRTQRAKLESELNDVKLHTSKVEKKKYDSVVAEKERLVQVNEDQRQKLKDWAKKVEDLEESWFRRVEQLKSELNNMERAKDDEKEEAGQVRQLLEEERELWDREVNELKAERRELEDVRDKLKIKLKETETQLKKTKKAKDAKDAEKDKEITRLRKRLTELDKPISLNNHGVAEMKALHAGEVEELKGQLEALKRDCDAKLESCRASFEKEINEWKEKATAAKQDFQKHLEAARGAHESDSRALKEKLASAEEDIASFVRQTSKLTNSLDQLQRAHDDAKTHWQSEANRMRGENERLERLLKSDNGHQNVLKSHTSSLEQHQHSISTLVEAVRGDIKSVKSLVQTSIEQTRGGTIRGSFNSLHDDLESIQTSLENTVSRMGNETQALIEHRDQMKALTDASSRADEAQKRFSEQQDRLVNEMQALREQIASSQRKGDEESLILDKVRLELVEELHRKETELAKNCAEINYLREELLREQQLREKAEHEILTLNDQADAYGEEVMRLQAVNKTLEEMHDLEHSVLNSGLEAAAAARPKLGGTDDRSLASNASSPMLDEALALAQSLTDLVHGSGSEEQETSVMAMLENISDLMDEHDRGRAAKAKKSKQNVPAEVAVRSRPLRARIEDQRDGHLEAVLSPTEAAEPLPITSPPNRSFFGEDHPSHLSVVVNELYSRCHLLERERTQIMESTLELLQAARDANDAELQAALSTARRKSAEELLKVQEESQRGMWRMYNNLCSFCRDDVLEAEEKKDIM